MSVIGTRLPPSLEEKVRRVCQELGRTPSQWLRELVQREIEGRELFCSSSLPLIWRGMPSFYNFC